MRGVGADPLTSIFLMYCKAAECSIPRGWFWNFLEVTWFLGKLGISTGRKSTSRGELRWNLLVRFVFRRLFMILD